MIANSKYGLGLSGIPEVYPNRTRTVYLVLASRIWPFRSSCQPMECPAHLCGPSYVTPIFQGPNHHVVWSLESEHTPKYLNPETKEHGLDGYLGS